MPIQNAKTPVVCPHCSKVMEGEVDDFVVPGRVGAGSRSITECEWCDGAVSVELIKEGSYSVEKAESSED